MKRSTENLAAILFFAAQTLCAAGKPLSLSKVQKTLDLVSAPFLIPALLQS